MRKSLALRFAAYFLALSLCVRLLENCVGYIGKYSEYFAASAAGVDIGMAFWPSSLFGLLTDMFGSGGILVRSMAPDLSNTFSVVSLLLMLGLVVLAAILFAGGPLRDCRKLCGRLDELPGGPGGRPSAGGAFRELDECVSRLDARLAAESKAHRDAGNECQAACEDAQAYLAAARGRIEAIAESGVLPQGGAETSIVLEALKNLISAEQAVERVRGRG